VPLTRSDEAARRLAAIVASSDDAIISKDLNGIVQSWNAAAERMYGYTEAEMIGQSILRIIPIERHGEEEEVLRRLRLGESVEHFETWRQRRDGSLLPVSLTVSPVRDEDGRIVGASKIARDISARRRADEMLARSEAARADLHRRLLTLVAASHSLVGDLQVDSVFDATIELARELVSADGYLLWRMVPGDEEWRVVRSFGLSEEFTRTSRPQNDGRSVPPPSIPLIAEDVLTNPSLAARADAYRREGIASLFVTPVRIGSTPSGALVFYYRQRHEFSEVEVQTATALGNLAAAGITSAELYEQERAAREDAHQANRIKDNFLATLSHELRTPLNAILGYTRMLLGPAADSERRQHFLKIIERNATALAEIVEDVLDVSRIATGKLTVRDEPVDLVNVVQLAVDTVMPMAHDKGVRLSVTFGVERAVMQADANRMQQVLWNLVTNAVKFTPADGTVSVELRRDHDQAVVVVKDTGTGIPAPFLAHIFEPFLQADTRPSREYGGLGLGLAITKRLVELHGGTITAESEGENKGATFTVVLPLNLPQ
jgi:PAS domain S-box-containing protein